MSRPGTGLGSTKIREHQTNRADKHTQHQRFAAAPLLGLLGFLVLAAAAVSVGIGSVKIPVDSFVRLSRILLMSAEADVPNELTGTLLILRDIRAPRVLVSLVIGATLGVCGAAMQGIFRNPLASPYLLGVASGANMGAALSIVLGVSGLLSGLGLPIGAFLGGLLAVSTVYGLSQARITGEASNTLILAGVALGALFTAVTSFLVFLSGSQMVEIIIWMMGSMGRGGWEELAWLTPVGVLGSALLIYRASDLNALALGDMGAHHLGIAPERTRRRIAGTVTVMTAAAVAVSGTIGFVGLVTPHAVRLIAGPDHRLLLPASALAGALFLLVADTVARTILSPVELPVGIITAVLGAPFFLYLLIHRSGGRIR